MNRPKAHFEIFNACHYKVIYTLYIFLTKECMFKFLFKLPIKDYSIFSDNNLASRPHGLWTMSTERKDQGKLCISKSNARLISNWKDSMYTRTLNHCCNSTRCRILHWIVSHQNLKTIMMHCGCLVLQTWPYSDDKIIGTWFKLTSCECYNFLEFDLILQ